MKRKNYLITVFLALSMLSMARTVSFETGIPAQFTATNAQDITTSDTYYKDGTKSLLWNFNPKSEINVKLDRPLSVTSSVKENAAFYLWVYNEAEANDSITIELLSPGNSVLYRFSYRLFSKGWRAGWIGLSHMQAVNAGYNISSYRIIAPDRKGKIYLDRITFPVDKKNSRIVPDRQMPFNNSLPNRPLYHWSRVWEWEQYEYDIPLPSSLSAQQQEEISTISKRLDNLIKPENAQETIDAAHEQLAAIDIKRSGVGFIGKPIVTDDEQNKTAGELAFKEITTIFNGLAYDVVLNKSEKSLQDYFLFWEYAIDQGFAWGSGMGTNHHYAYSIRSIWETAWLMRHHIYKAAHGKDILATLNFWSALPETRQPLEYGRDELIDTWNTLLMPKLISAMLEPDERQCYRNLQGLSRWLSQSLLPNEGTIGGIKIDGSTFHHGGLYPAYAIGAFKTFSRYLHLADNTLLEPSLEAKKSLRSALLCMRNYSNKYDWGVGLAGRHPFKFSIGSTVVDAFAYLALAGDLSDEGKDIDYELAADYMRLATNSNNDLYREFRRKGIRAAKAPHGMFVYNYGSLGIYRQKEWMVTLKGFNKDVWGCEIFSTDNNYGRYQSYGTVQIMGYRSNKESGFQENGWDWNRLPGTTTIHLPFNQLYVYSSQIKTTENFAGSSSLANNAGIFAMKLKEPGVKNATSDFVARKSVFCFDNRIICLGSGISNSNHNYPTETTLFQSTFASNTAPYIANQKLELGYLQSFNAAEEKDFCIRDGYNNYYFLKEGNVTLQVATQKSLHDKTHKETTGNFSAAWINHGKAPKNEGYEYLVWIQPEANQLNQVNPLNTYQVIQKDNNAHIVTDIASGTHAYAAFEAVQFTEDALIKDITRETLLMWQKKDQAITMSVCDPNLNIAEKGYTTIYPSRPLSKTITLKGKWKLNETNPKVTTTVTGNETQLSVTCQHGLPVEFTLIDADAESGLAEVNPNNDLMVIVHKDGLFLQAHTPALVKVYTNLGKMVACEKMNPYATLQTPLTNGVYLVEIESGACKKIQKVIL